ncbi:MAG: hypothetical protein JW787_11375 [Sedimentisphaerales bacterium]|nr:hypothetical protein [Sedimentisphaerales bacterium]
MKNTITKFAVAAVVVIACLIGFSIWRTTGSGIALGNVLARVEQVKAYRYKKNMQFWSEKVTGEDPKKPYNFREVHGTFLISQEYGWQSKMEHLDPNGGKSTFDEYCILPQKNTTIAISHKEKKYTRKEQDDGWIERVQKANIDIWDPSSRLKRILKFKYESMGRSTIDGVEVEGFRTTDPNHGESKNSKVDIKLWVDVKTLLPMRYDSLESEEDIQRGDKIITHWVDDYQWDVSVDAAEFEPIIPDGYASWVVKYPANITEETVIQGLKILVELLGKYPDPDNITDTNINIDDFAPTVLRLAEKSETPAAMRLKEEIKGLTDVQINNKLVDFLVPIRGVGRFYFWLQNDKKSPAYYGNIVTPKDADKVLMRWKVSDNQYRVIYGDLHAETVTPEKLAELEADLPK